MDTIIKTEGLNKEFILGGFPRNIKIKALNDVNITVASQEPAIISIVGESGSGKTTLAKVILAPVAADFRAGDCFQPVGRRERRTAR